jgi:stage II sporulation protein D
MRIRAVLVLAVLAALALGSSPADARTADAPVGAATAVVIGHGYGHGKGLSQYGAYAHAQNGEGYRSILGFYYPHTRFGSAAGRVRVWISADTDHNTIVLPATGLRLVDLGSGRSYRLPVGKAKAWKLAAPTGVTRVFYRNAGVWHRYLPGGRGALRGVGEFRSTAGVLKLQIGSTYLAYRGNLRLTQGRTVNVLSLENYLRGVIPVEIFASWPVHALRAQAVAARTYAAYERVHYLNRTYQICDTSACQVYKGLAAEDSHTNAAIAATAGQVLTYQGALAFTQFSADNGGWKADGGLPYLASGQDPLDTGLKYSDWSVPVDVTAIQAAYPSLGTLNTLQITARQSDGHRVANVRFTFAGGFRDVTGDKFRGLLGLKSTYFSLS